MTRTRFASRAKLRLDSLEDRTVPATFTVTTSLDVVDPADGKRSLREAISAANATLGVDVILLPAGVFKVALAGAGENANLNGDFDVTDSVTIRGAGAGLTAIDGQQLDRVFDAFGTAPRSIRLVLEKVAVRNGRVTGHGGGIQVGNANLAVVDSAVAGNQASLTGGGISNEAAPGTGNVTLVRTTVARNVAGTHGGGLNATGLGTVLTLKDSAVRRNICGQDGGGIDSEQAILTSTTVSGNIAGNSAGGIDAGTGTLTNCTINGNSAGFGGGLNVETLTLTNCSVTGNTATSGSGGGISSNTATLTNSTVSGNVAASGGGGIRAGAATLTNCTVSGNRAASNGGGIDADTATLILGTISNNAAGTFGGGIAGVTATLKASTVSGNRAGNFGGGVAADTATLGRSTLSGNTAGTNGGGVSADVATMTNCTVAGNTAGANGGGVFAGDATLLNCTVAENIAGFGGGILRDGGVFNVKNTIVALNQVTSGGTGPDVFGAFTSQGHNLIGIGAGGSGFTNGVNGDLVGTSLNPIDPLLGPLANNGGPTKTMALLAGSKAIDRGDNAGIPGTDQRGLPRKKDGNGDGVAVVDIGAFER